MKKTIALLLIFAFLLTAFSSCAAPAPETAKSAVSAGTEAKQETKGAATADEPAPVRILKNALTERPNYVLHEGASADEMRALAIRAMREALSVNWYIDRILEYTYTSPNTGDTVSFRLFPGQIYAGVPYSSSYTGLFQMLEYYEFGTGRLKVPNEQTFAELVGNDCAGGILWAYAACVPGFDPASDGYGRRSENMVAVGPYRLPAYEEEKSTVKICQANGEQTMYESYAMLCPADTVFTGGNTGIAGHYMMLLEKAKVVRNPDGTIDGKQSTVVIQDQRRGHRSTDSKYVVEEDGEKHHYSGGWDTEHSFEYLWENSYIPVTCEEFLGRRPYAMPSVSLDREVSSLEDLKEATLKSQYLICAFHIRLLDENGEEVYFRSKPTGYSLLTARKLKNFPLCDLLISPVALSRATGLSGVYTLAIDCIDATGTGFDAVSFPITLP